MRTPHLVIVLGVVLAIVGALAAARWIEGPPQLPSTQRASTQAGSREISPSFAPTEITPRSRLRVQAEAPLVLNESDQEPQPSAESSGDTDLAPASPEKAPAPERGATAPVESKTLTRSWVVPMELGWDGAEAGDPVPTAVAYAAPRVDPQDPVFTARVVDGRGEERRLAFSLRGLAPRELARTGADHEVGDHVFLARAPLLLRLPLLPLPARVEFFDPEGAIVASLRLEEGPEGLKTVLE